jgi:hypothetical protein
LLRLKYYVCSLFCSAVKRKSKAKDEKIGETQSQKNVRGGKNL